MTVYIEYVIIDNLVITSLICLISYRLLGIRASRLRVLIAAIVGTIAAALYPFLAIHYLLLLLVKLSLFIVLSLILFYKKTKLFRASAVFLLITAFFGGFIFLVAYIISGDAVTALTLPSYDFPFGVILFIPTIIYFFLKTLILDVRQKRLESNYSYKFKVTALGNSALAVGFLDSGNMLVDEKSGLPIIIAGAKLTLKLLSQEQLRLVLCNKGNEICVGARYINFDTISKENQILIVPTQSFELYFDKGVNIFKEVMLGLSFKGLKGEYDALLSPLILNIGG